MNPREARIVLNAEVSIRKTQESIQELRDRKIIPSWEGSKGDGVHRQQECICEGKDQHRQSRGWAKMEVQGARSQGGTRDCSRRVCGHHGAKGRACAHLRSAAGGLLSELC